MVEILNVSTSDGRYTVVLRRDGTSHVLRYGEPWTPFPEGGSVGNVVIALGLEIETLRDDLANLREELDGARSAASRAQGAPAS